MSPVLRFPAPSAAALASAVAWATTLNAATVVRHDYQSAAGVCQGALPAFAGTLRARPLGLGNEGDAAAFVTCAQQTDDATGNARTNKVHLRLGNAGATAVTINCTFVHGFGAGPPPVYVTRTVVVEPGGAPFLTIHPTNVDPSATQLFHAQWSCALPPGAAIRYTGRDYVMNVGA